MSDLAAQLIEEEEGPSSPLVYPDSRGFATIARGCLVDARPALHAEGLCPAALAAQDAYTLAKARTRAANIAGFQRCSDVRQAVVVSMCFQLGDLHGWPDFKSGMANGDYNLVADNMLYNDVSDHTRSDWDKQTSRRCEREAWMMRNNVWLNRADPIPTTGGSLET